MQFREMKICILLIMSFLLIALSASACTAAPSPATTSLTTAPTTTEQTTAGWDAAKVMADLAKIPDDYSSEQALKDGCYVFGIVTENQNQAIDFVQKAEAGENASLRMVGFTIEGDPIIFQIDLINDTFHVIYDGTRDKFGSFGVNEYTYKYIVSYDDNGQKVYFLVNDQTLTLAQINELSEAGQLDEFEIYRLPFVFE